MMLLDVNCVGMFAQDCQKKINAKYPKIVSVLHIQGKHICTAKTDYNSKGELPKSINDLAWKLGGVKKRINKKVISPPGLSQTEKDMIRDMKKLKQDANTGGESITPNANFIRKKELTKKIKTQDLTVKELNELERLERGIDNV